MISSPSTFPLQGIRVVDLSRLLPGPYLTQLLADLGAEVVKVETPLAGDYARMAPPETGLAGLYAAVNGGKKSLAVNHRRPEGREILYRLVAEADVFVEGFRPGAVKRWGLDYETLRGINARLVYLSLSGYGQTGPYRDRAGHDLNYQAIGGSLGLNGAAGGPPVPPSIPLADLGGATFAAIAILAAIIGRERTGEGMYLDMALADAVVAWMGPLAGGPLFAEGIRPERGKMPLAGGLPCFNVYETADGRYVSLAPVEPHLWGNFCRGVGREAWQARQWDATLIPEVAALFRQRTLAEWLAFADEADVCLEPVLDYEETLRHPQIRHRGLVLEDESGRPAGIAAPFPFLPSRNRAPAPALGQHSAEILRRLGYDEEAIRSLAARGVVALGRP